MMPPTNPTLSDLKAAVKDLLDLPASKSILRLNSNTCERAFEAYIFGLCLKAVKNAGGSIELRGINTGKNPNPIIFRGSPGTMKSRDQNFCYAKCELQGKRFEIHLDVEYQGQSGVPHEMDISICEANHCDNVRLQQITPKTGKNLIMLFECKFYTKMPGVALARTFVGLKTDCSGNRLAGFVANKASPLIDKFLSKKSNPTSFTELTPLNSGIEERFIRAIELELARWASSM